MTERKDERPVVEWSWFNDCANTAVKALRYLSRYDRPIGGETPFNGLHLHHIADELERDLTRLAATLAQEGRQMVDQINISIRTEARRAEATSRAEAAEAERDRLAADNARKDAELRDRERLIHHLVSWIEDDVGAELPLDEDQFNLARAIRAALAGKE